MSSGRDEDRAAALGVATSLDEIMELLEDLDALEKGIEEALGSKPASVSPGARSRGTRSTPPGLQATRCSPLAALGCAPDGSSHRKGARGAFIQEPARP